MGKLYDEKKSQMKQEVEKIRKDEEDQILNNLKSKYSASKRNQSTFVGSIGGGAQSQRDYSKSFDQQQRSRMESNGSVVMTLPVEERLQIMQKKYEERLKQKKHEILQSEVQEVKNPMINPKSVRMVEKKEGFQKLKVEDRLITMGQLWKHKKEAQLKDYLDEVENRAYPVLN